MLTLSLTNEEQSVLTILLDQEVEQIERDMRENPCADDCNEWALTTVQGLLKKILAGGD